MNATASAAVSLKQQRLMCLEDDNAFVDVRGALSSVATHNARSNVGGGRLFRGRGRKRTAPNVDDQHQDGDDDDDSDEFEGSRSTITH